MTAWEQLCAFYEGKRVLVTGHTGFKGGWLCLVLERLGARVSGVALAPDREGVYERAHVGDGMQSTLLDIRAGRELTEVVHRVDPELVLHLAAQALVPSSFMDPVGTFDVNVVGTASVLNACSGARALEAVLVVTSDKVYANDGRGVPFREEDPLGGGDPYSCSKAAAELVVTSWRHSFIDRAGWIARLATARAGNVIGGGDTSSDRLVPDIVRAISAGKPAKLRSPDALRPWQFVLEPIMGYLHYVMAMAGESPNRGQLPHALNFGPEVSDLWSVRAVADTVIEEWGSGSWVHESDHPIVEAPALTLDSAAARAVLGWQPVLSTDEAIRETVAWYAADCTDDECRAFTDRQIDSYLERMSA